MRNSPTRRIVTAKMCITLFLFLCWGCFGCESVDVVSSNFTTRTAKWSLFNLFFSRNEPCEGIESRVGICIDSKECKLKHGQKVGTCAQGFGVCCSFTQTCGGTISENGTDFVSPDYPFGTVPSGSCTIRVNKISEQICQFRLDFEEFSMIGPNPSSGRCDRDSLVVMGQDRNNAVPAFCGSNSGQHAYVEVYSSTGPFTLMATASTDNFLERKWKIKVTQIECDSPWKAPALCLQYHTGLSGTLQSFNYHHPRENERGYPVNLDYSICIRKEIGMCSIGVIKRSDFGIGTTGDNCPDDYLTLSHTKYCGDSAFDEEVKSSGWGPIIISFRSSQRRSDNSIGFNLRFNQIPCSTGG